MTESKKKLAGLRQALAERGLAGFVIPRADEHQGEYVPPHAERLAYLTGFTGSAGVAVVMRERAVVFVDGRYTLQAGHQVDGECFEVVPTAEKSVEDWLVCALNPGDRLAIDPWLHTKAGVERLEKALAKAGAALATDQDNLVDAIWDDQPAPPQNPAEVHPLELAGMTSAEKRQAVAETLAKDGCRAAVLSLPDSIAWLLNIRGGDVPHIPVVLSFAVLFDDGRVDWFVDAAKLPGSVRDALGMEVSINAPANLLDGLETLGRDGAKVLADPASAPYAVFRTLTDSGAGIHEAPDPCLLPKAIKNDVELAGSRAAHLRDGVAVSRFLHWMDREAPGGTVTEMAAADRMEDFRKQTNLLMDLSFDTISGAGPNGAIVHYRVTAETDRALAKDELYLVDSGGQYRDGTTDITRTIVNGTPSEEMRDRYTRVLKGHIAVATAVFPRGTTGAQLDALARMPLWQAGVDFEHGTGHGIGSYLSVHEGPQSISKRANATKLVPGMILSNEPGYYKTGAYGIRLENLVVVEERVVEGAEKTMLGFETISFAPFDRRLIEPALLTVGEKGWLNAYHARVREKLADGLAPDVRVWLEAATAPV